MRSYLSQAIIFLMLLNVQMFGVSAVSYPVTTPSGEQAGGWFQTYFDNMYTAPCPAGQVLEGFTSSGVLRCVIPVASGLYITGQTLGDTLRFDGTEWVRSNFLYNSGTAIGINTQTPGATLDINGTVKISGGTPGAGKVLTSDASGLASWQTPTSSTSWELLGNAGTTAGTNFVGTTDNISLIFKVNNTIAGILGNTTDSNTYYGLGAGNTSNTNLSSVGIGRNSLFSNITGLYNTAVGFGSLYANSIGSSNVAYGYNALYLSSGDSNIGIGYDAGSTLTSGSNNIFIGAGIQPNINTTASNQLNIGNWIYGNSGSIGIGVQNPGAKLDINGSIKITDGTQGSGKVLISDTNGLAYWGNASATSVTASGITGGTEYYITKFGAGGNGIFASQMYDNGATVGVGTSTLNPQYRMMVQGGLLVSGQITIQGGSPGPGKVLVSDDATGMASWSTPPAATTVYATGVLAMSSSGGYITKFMAGGTGITSSVMYETGGKVAIGTVSPTYTFDVQGPNSIIRAGSGFCLGMTASGCVDDWTDLNNVVKSMGTPHYLAKFNSGGLIDNSQLYETGGKLYIGDITDIISGGATIGYVTIETFGSTNSTNPFLTLSENGGQECRLWINGANKLGSNCAWSAGFAGTYQPNQIIKADSAGVDLTGSIMYENGGNVGIGISSPSYKLHVGGSAFFTGNVTIQGNLIVDKIINRTVNNVSISGSLLPDTSAPLVYRDIGTSTGRWNNLYLSGQITIGGGAPGVGKYLVSDATGLASWTGLVTATSLNLAGAALGNTLYYDGTNWVFNNNIYNAGGNIGIGILGTAPVPTSKFEIWSGSTTQHLMHFRNASLGIGVNATRYLASGNQNTGIGNDALRTLTTGYSNTAIGNSSLYNNMQGYFNTAGGTQALYTNSNGNWNVALGSQALYTNNGGSNNVGIGGQALYLNSSGNGNTALGDNALRATTASNNIGIGYGAGSGITTGSNNIAIGVGAQVYNNTASNQLNIGNWIYGSGGNIGIGTGNNLTSRLVLDSGANHTSGLKLPRINNTSPAYTGAAIGLGVDANGNVVPVSNGDVVVYDALDRTTPPTPDPNVAGRAISYDFNNYFDIPTKQSFVVSSGDSSSYNGPFIRSNGTSALCSWNGTYGTSPYNCQTDTDEFGVSASPWNSFTMTAKGDVFGYQLALGARGDAPLFARSGRFNGAVGGGLYTNDSPYQTPAPWQKVLTIPVNHTEYFYINTGYNSQLQAQANGGRIGIGTTSPNYGVDIRSEVGMMNRVYLTGTVATATSPTLSFAGDTNMGIFRPAVDTLAFATNGSERVRIFSNGNVTIGGTTSSAKLRVDGQVMITGGTPGVGKVLTSDATGLATWQAPSGGGGGGGTTILQATVNLDLPSISNNNCSLQTFNVPGAVTGKTAWISPDSDLGSSTNTTLFIASTRVSAADTVEVKFCNESGSAVNRPAMNFYVSVIQ